MKGRTIILDHLGDIEAAALMVNGQLEDLLVDTPDAARVGTIYRAIADRPVKGQGGMFLKTPDGSAFLRQIKGLIPGQPLLVQVVRLCSSRVRTLFSRSRCCGSWSDQHTFTQQRFRMRRQAMQ